MFQVIWKDNNGVSLKNGDTYRIFSIMAEMQYEDCLFYSHQVGTEYKWVEKIFSVDEDEDGFIMHPGVYYDRDQLCELWDLPTDTGEDEFRECVLEPIWEVLGKELGESETIDAINGFEIIPKPV
jgi:hypothetical protein